MAKVSHIQTSFKGGEVSPRMKGRPDTAIYQNGAERIENGIVLVHGGIDRRDGLRFCAEAKQGGDYPAFVIRYVFNRDQAYVLEFGHLYVRFYDVDGSVLVDEASATLEIASPFTAEQLADVSYSQGGDTLFLYHPDVPTQRLRRLSATVWAIDPVPWVAEPFAEVGHRPTSKLSIDDPSVGAGRTFTTIAASVPDAPTNVTAVPMNGAARVSFDPPANDGGDDIISYTVTSNPGGFTSTGSGTTQTMLGLTNNTAYTFTVVATNSAGSSVASSASSAVTPLASLASPTITVTASPLNQYLAVGNGLVRFLTGPTASATSGAGPFTYAWAKVSGSPGISIDIANTTATDFRSTGTNTTNTAVFEVTATDSLGSTGSVRVNVSVKHGNEFGGGPGPITIEP